METGRLGHGGRMEDHRRFRRGAVVADAPCSWANLPGPTPPKGSVPVYRANGVACFLISLGLLLLGGSVFRWFEPTIVNDNFAGIIGALNVSSSCTSRAGSSPPDRTEG